MNHRPKRLAVLVVDDSPEFVAVAGSWIDTRPDLSLVGTACNGVEALDGVARLAPDVVIIDAFMPAMDGFAATRAIKNRLAAPWVVMVSVHEGTTMEQEAWAAGADAFVAKADLAARMPLILEGLRDGRVAATRATGPAAPPVRHPEDPPIEQRAIDACSLTARAIEVVRIVLGLGSDASASFAVVPRSRSSSSTPQNRRS